MRDDSGDLDAGAFLPWLEAARAAVRGEGDAEVPCGGCTACCTSAQFVAIEPDEVEALARIPPELLFPAPRRPPGHVVLGYDEQGRCPMLGEAGCSIYEHRPRTCRSYDCRVLTAAGVEPEGDRQVALAERVRRWRFRLPSPAAEAAAGAVRAAGAALAARALPGDEAPAGPTATAVLAIEVAGTFLDPSGTEVVDPGPEAVATAVRIARRRR